ncbi:NAD(P)/FAD-dependent oxidoreductase [Burkholderia sp. MR1-5-21]
MDTSPGIVIVGAGLAGTRAALALRVAGFTGRLTLLSGESCTPYDRPPLSKGVLLGQQTMAESVLATEQTYVNQMIDLRLDAVVTSIDRSEKFVVLADGQRLSYERLLLATGAVPRRLALPGAERVGVTYLRTADDAERMARALRPGRRVVLVGGGFIGLEVAASAIAAGCEVTVLEATSRLLARAVPAPIAARIEARHRAAGVDFRFSTGIAEIDGDAAVSGVWLTDGERLPCDLLVVGIGATPATALAEAAGLDVADGIVVNDRLMTSDPNIYAAGDVCSFPYGPTGRHVRLECWKNAEDQARVAAQNLLGENVAYGDVPWFWSDQYELSIQITGLPQPDHICIERHVASDTLLLFHCTGDGCLIAASGVGPGNVGRDIRIAQMLIGRRATVAPALLADPNIKLKSLLTRNVGAQC